jgi:3-hydroxyisobutyrate dehydrogenase-like beta-hydroxyacid dehydrogenase
VINLFLAGCITAVKMVDGSSVFIVHSTGDIGLGTRMKLVLNMFVGTTLAALAESLALSAKLGLNLTHVLDVLRHSSANSQFVQEKGGGKLKAHIFVI